MPRAVPGMNCAIPCAPAELTANGLKPLSAKICAASSVAETLQRCAARLSAGSKRAGTKSGRPPAPPDAPSAAAAPARGDEPPPPAPPACGDEPPAPAPPCGDEPPLPVAPARG